MALSIQCITIDSHDPQKLAEFWAAALGWSIGKDVNEVEVWIEREINNPRNTGFPDILFLKNSDERKVKNRLHLDLRPENQEVEVTRLESLGATRIDIGQSSSEDCSWIVMADPEGNEFCVLRARQATL